MMKITTQQVVSFINANRSEGKPPYTHTALLRKLRNQDSEIFDLGEWSSYKDNHNQQRPQVLLTQSETLAVILSLKPGRESVIDILLSEEHINYDRLFVRIAECLQS